MNHPDQNYQHLRFKTLRIITGAALLIFIFSAHILAQQDSTIAEVEKIYLKEGSILVGNIQSEDDSLLTFRTLSNMEIVIVKNQILKREKTSGTVVKGEFWRSDPNQTRMLFAPTARPLKAGQGYISFYEVFFPFVAVGITDFLAISGGMSLFPGASSQLLYVAPKITPVHLEKFDLSAGALYISIPEEVEDAGIAYGVTTYGTEKASFTFGLGWGFTTGDFENKPIIVVGGDVRLSDSFKLLTENWIPPESDFALISLGLRFFGENLAADFGLIFPAGADIEGFPFLPWLGFAYNFGSSR